MRSYAGRTAIVIAVVTMSSALTTFALPARGAVAKPKPKAQAHKAPVHKAPAHKAHPAPPPSPAPDAPANWRQIGGPLLASDGIVVHYPAGKHPWKLPKVPASAYVIADADNGQVLAAKDAHGLFPPASTLKVLTAITMLPRLNPNAQLKASKLATSVEPNIVGLVRGRTYRVADLFRALLLISANDAAVTLVQGAGSFSKGMALLNAEAHHLQAYDVVAKQPNGLPAPGQVVSAYDLALIARQALSMPAFMKYDSTWSAKFRVNKKKLVDLVNQNYLLTQYKGGIGGKIGWTEAAEATYVGMARRHGVTLIVSILHCTSLQEITSAEKLLNWGFAMAGHVEPVGTLVAPLAPKPAHPAPAHSSPAKPTVNSQPVAIGRSQDGRTDGSKSAQLTVGVTLGSIVSVGLAGFVLYRRRHLATEEPAADSGPS
ncbi:MAG TPA: D-alanyl-D-alanine carboxypeptidase [Streptosporangiaceae bacterium]|nr:D-alanyl-D-alanine carboxypeptidase [Streptosporangiaceae bacterium]